LVYEEFQSTNIAVLQSLDGSLLVHCDPLYISHLAPKGWVKIGLQKGL
jgi:hypothetical protein